MVSLVETIKDYNEIPVTSNILQGNAYNIYLTMTPLPSLIQFLPPHKLIRIKNHNHIPHESLNHKYFTHADEKSDLDQICKPVPKC